MKVPRHVKAAFDAVVGYMKMTPNDIAECKAEFEADPEWGMEFYPRAASIIRAACGQTADEREQQQ